MVQVPHIDAKLQGAGGDDDAIAVLAEGLFRLAPFGKAQGRVGDEGAYLQVPQGAGQLLDPGAAVAEDQPLRPPVQYGDDNGRVRQGADMIDGHIRIGRGCGLPHHHPRPAAGEPAQQFPRITDGGRQPDALDGAKGECAHPVQDRPQMPAPVVPGKGVQLIHDGHTQGAEPGGPVHPQRDEHALQGLRHRQQYVRGIPQAAGLGPLADIAVPDLDAPPHQGRIAAQASFQVVEQGLDRTDVQDTQATPVLGEHARQHGDDRRLGLAARGGRKHQTMAAGQDGRNGRKLLWAQRLPAERIDDVVGNRGVKPIEGTGTHSSMSSRPIWPARSWAVISAPPMVRA